MENLSIPELANSEIETDAERQVLEEYTNINNNQAYDHTFRCRAMTLRDGRTQVKSPDDYFGVDSRARLSPTLKTTLDNSILNSFKSGIQGKEFQFLDVGGGSGSPIDWIFAEELLKNEGKKENIINIIEPNPNLLKIYLKTMEKYPHLKKGIVYQGYVQDYYEENRIKMGGKKPPLLPNKFDFINIIHVIYHLTDYKQRNLDPYKVIVDFVSFLYSILKPGGALYIAYRDQNQDFGGHVQERYLEEILHEYDSCQNIFKINQARDELFYQGRITEFLESKNDEEEKIKTKPKIETSKHGFSFYAKTLADLSVLGLCGNFMESNEEKFDKRKLEFILNEIKDAALMKVEDGKERRFGLGRIERDGKMVWKVDASQVICVIKKEIIS